MTRWAAAAAVNGLATRGVGCRVLEVLARVDHHDQSTAISETGVPQRRAPARGPPENAEHEVSSANVKRSFIPAT